MGDPKGFLHTTRQHAEHRPAHERVNDYREVVIPRSERHAKEQAGRCMDCGTPFCHWACPIGNYIPEWNDEVFRGNWRKAFELLQASNNLPEVTGRVCPALCEYSCVLGINTDPVTIRENELSIIEQAYNAALIKPRRPKSRTAKKIAVIGSGPAGLSCADQLNQAGHNVKVFEKADKPGGILRYGIPDFKLDKWIIDRRINIWKKEGIEFVCGVNAGFDYKINKLKKEFDAICLCGGSRKARDMDIEGRNLRGIHLAMDYLTQSNKRVSGIKIPHDEAIDAQGKKVVVIGGGDTGSDCVGTAHRQGASSVVQIELLPCPPEQRSSNHPWPKYPVILKTTSSHEEGGDRCWSVLTKKFIGDNGALKKLSCVRVEFQGDGKNSPVMKEILGSEFEVEADLVILAMGFAHPEHNGLLDELGLAYDKRGNVQAGVDFQTSVPGIFSAGDMRRGQSLVVWAISEGRQAARSIDLYLMGRTDLPRL